VKVAVYPADEGGCGHYRMTWPAQAAAQAGYDVTLGSELEPIQIQWSEPFEGDPPPWVDPQGVVSTPDVDVMVFQRVLHRQFVEVVPMLQARGIRVVIDIDDLFDQVARANVAWYAMEEHWHTVQEVELLCRRHGQVKVTKRSNDGHYLYVPGHEANNHRQNLKRTLQRADQVTVSTDSLLDSYRPHVRTPMVAVRNGPPVGFLHDPRERKPNPLPQVGWSGSVATHPGDLEVMRGAVAQVRRQHLFLFKIVGTGVGVKSRVGIEADVTTGWVALDEYPFAYASLDIALCPLADNAFNRAKSWIKPLEAASVGVVPIMSPTPEYRRLHELGIGLLARSPREWAGALRRLLVDQEYRFQLQVEGFEVARRLTVDSQVDSWWAAWTGGVHETEGSGRGLARGGHAQT
jgi:glycosyltransferase involved in cell wall biosynthesis